MVPLPRSDEAIATFRTLPAGMEGEEDGGPRAVEFSHGLKCFITGSFSILRLATSHQRAMRIGRWPNALNR